jgi:alpha-tubulin suppressor-like RCC1 family protein
MVIDSRNALMVWGKWKNSGDGGQGTPWLYPKYFTGLNGWDITDISCGGTCLFALSEQSTISWGQGCNHGELGHGADRPKSATNAVKVDDLEECTVSSVSCGLGQTLLLVDKGESRLKDLPVIGELSVAAVSPLKVSSPVKVSTTKGSPVKVTSPKANSPTKVASP